MTPAQFHEILIKLYKDDISDTEDVIAEAVRLYQEQRTKFQELQADLEKLKQQHETALGQLGSVMARAQTMETALGAIRMLIEGAGATIARQ